jgi:hypothetical protein
LRMTRLRPEGCGATVVGAAEARAAGCMAPRIGDGCKPV